MKRTLDLERGDRVKLSSGLVRTVARVEPSAYVNYRNETIYTVSYLEGRTPQWSGANTGIAESEWDLVP